MAKKEVQTKNGFPILTEKNKIPFGTYSKKPYERASKEGTVIKPTYPYTVKNIIDRPEENNPKHYGKDFDAQQANYNIKNSVYVNHACQMIEARRTGNLPSKKEIQLFDKDIAEKIISGAKEITKRININSTYGLYDMGAKNSKFEKIEIGLSQKIRFKKDLKDLFKPLNRVKIKFAIGLFEKIFPNEDKKLGVNTLTILKMLAYIKEDKSDIRKFYPDDKDIDHIICGALIYDLTLKHDKDLDTILTMLEAGILRTMRQDERFLSFFDEVQSILRRIEYQELDSSILDEFEHYDTKFKWLRSLKEPKLEVIIDNILEVIALKKLNTKRESGSNKEFDNGVFLLNLVKKLGLRYITSRSNLEWALYGPQLKRIRNFMSKKTYFIYLTTIKSRIIAQYSFGDGYATYDGEAGGKNITLLFNTLEKTIAQKSKKHVHKK